MIRRLRRSFGTRKIISVLPWVITRRGTSPQTPAITTTTITGRRPYTTTLKVPAAGAGLREISQNPLTSRLEMAAEDEHDSPSPNYYREAAGIDMTTAPWAKPPHGILIDDSLWGDSWGFPIFRTCYDAVITTDSGEVMQWDEIKAKIEDIATKDLRLDAADGFDPKNRLKSLKFHWIEDKEKFDQMSADDLRIHFNSEETYRRPQVENNQRLRSESNPICLMVDHASAASVTRTIEHTLRSRRPPPFIWAVDGLFGTDLEENDLEEDEDRPPYNGSYKVPLEYLMGTFWHYMANAGDDYYMDDFIPGELYQYFYADI